MQRRQEDEEKNIREASGNLPLGRDRQFKKKILPPAPLPNRLHIVLVHTSRYAFEGQARLAADCGVSRSTISRLIRGRSSPSFRLVQAITAALEKALDRPMDPRELFSLDGTYPTRSGCALCGCNGCFPEEAYDRYGNLRPAFYFLQPGDWTLAPARPLRMNPASTDSPLTHPAT